MNLLRLIGRALASGALGLIAILAGCGSGGFGGGGIGEIMYGPVAMYGVSPGPRPPGDPTVEIVDFSYTPANPITAGEGIVFAATLNKESDSTLWGDRIQVTLGTAEHPITESNGWFYNFFLRDDGGMYDDVAGDLIYSGAFEWRTDYGVAEGLPVMAKLTWFDDTPDVIFTGEPLTVVAGEAE